VASRHTPNARPPLALLPEALKAGLWQSLGGWRRWYRSSWAYRRFLKGQLTDRIDYQPQDLHPRRLEEADALLRGRFKFEGEMVDAGTKSIFDVPPVSEQWNEALHGFAWLAPLAAAGGEASRTLATNLVSQWLKRHSKYSEPAWLPHVMARRLLAIFAHGRFIVTASDMLWRSKVFVSLREQSRMLARIAHEAPPGLPRIEAAAALTLSGICLADSSRRVEAGIERLEAELAEQILPDGGHISRSPETLVEVYRLLIMVLEALGFCGYSVPVGVRGALDRMSPMVRFFRHGDGGLALFNGGGESSPRMIQTLLQRDDVKGQPFGYARHSGYHRMSANRTMVVFDCGTPPPGAYSSTAHAGCLAFELGAGIQRIVVNCGTALLGGHRRWQPALRATAAHSTLTLADTSSATVLRPGWVRRCLGARLVHGPVHIETRRMDNEKGTTVVASHDGYLKPFGIRHERELTLSPHGLALTGIDRLIPAHMPSGHERKEAFNFAIRFHIHPDVRVSTAQNGDVVLKLPNGEGWRLRATGAIGIEESVYLGGDIVRRGEQVVVSGTVKNEITEIGWMIEQIGGAVHPN
jgi:uncharacterized heparinase superfamily protein